MFQSSSRLCTSDIDIIISPHPHIFSAVGSFLEKDISCSDSRVLKRRVYHLVLVYQEHFRLLSLYLALCTAPQGSRRPQ